MKSKAKSTSLKETLRNVEGNETGGKNDHSAASASLLLLLLLYCLFILTGSHCGALPGLELTM